jgi:hypothetical protein
MKPSGIIRVGNRHCEVDAAAVERATQLAPDAAAGRRPHMTVGVAHVGI